MGGFYIIVGGASPDRIRRAAERVSVPRDVTEIIDDPHVAMAWVSQNDPSRFGPAHDPASGVRVILSGRIGLDEDGWRRAAELGHLRGGTAARLLLQQYLDRGIAGIERHNGPAALVVWDPRDRTLHTLTDHFGYHPAYVREVGGVTGTVIASLPRAIAADEAVETRFDEVSAVEFLHQWRITPPNTFYEQVQHIGPATHLTLDLGRGTSHRRAYWRPFEGELDTSLTDSAERLAEVVREAIRIRTLPELGLTLAFVSGGLDSRAILFGCASRATAIGANLYDEKNNEAEVSEALCAAALVPYLGIRRRPDHYTTRITEWVDLGGGMTSAEDDHFEPLRDLVGLIGARTVMTACTTDWIFKGYGLEKRYRTLAGRNLPILELTSERRLTFLPNVGTAPPPTFQEAVTQRLESWFAGTPTQLRTERDRLLVEDRRVRPACYAPSVSGQIMYRIFPYDTFLSDRRLADHYARTPASWKLNSRIWGLAMRRLCEGARDIVDANYGWKVGSSEIEKLVAFGKGWVRRRLTRRRRVRSPLATQGSWPNLGWVVANDDAFRRSWSAVAPLTRERIAGYWGSDPWARPLAEWASDVNGAFRILTLGSAID